MRKKAFSEAQIALALRDEETEAPATEVCRKMGVSEQSFYRGNVDQHGHRDTNSGNTPVCAYCHANGANSPRPAPTRELWCPTGDWGAKVPRGRMRRDIYPA